MLKEAKNKFGPPRVYGAAHVCVFKASGTLPIDLPAREQLAGGDLVVSSEIGDVFDFEANDPYILHDFVLFSTFFRRIRSEKMRLVNEKPFRREPPTVD